VDPRGGLDAMAKKEESLPLTVESSIKLAQDLRM
jgi:hypothetical protein